MSLDLVETLGQLVAVPSVNPMGGAVGGPEFLETKLTDHLEAVFDRLGLSHQRQPIEPGRDNLIARLNGEIPPERGGQLVLLDAHQDTVPVAGMTIEPWTPVVRDGRLYGRGACDTKGSMAAMIVAVARLAQHRPAGMPTVVISCTVNEEFGFTGVRGLTRLWTDTPQPAGRTQIIPRPPDIAVVGEPTNLEVVVAHKGAVRWRIRTRGRASHSAQPELGDNAVYKMGQVLPVLQRYQEKVVGGLASHPLCGPATISVGTIRGGVSVNTVPDECVVEIDRRTPPGDDSRQARQHLIDYLAAQSQIDFPLEHEPAFLELPPLSDEDNGPLAEQFGMIAQQVVGDCPRVGKPYGTDATYLAAAGVPSVVFGPGAIEQAHTDEEWISIEQLEKAAEVYYQFARVGMRR